MRKNDFDVPNRTVQCSAKLKTERKNINMSIKTYLCNNSWVLELSNKFYLAHHLQLYTQQKF